MKVLIILALCAVALAVDVPTTVAPVVNGTVVNGTTVVPPTTLRPVVPPPARQSRFLTLVNGYYYDRVYDVVYTPKQYDYYFVKKPVVYEVNRDIEITY